MKEPNGIQRYFWGVFFTAIMLLESWQSFTIRSLERANVAIEVRQASIASISNDIKDLRAELQRTNERLGQFNAGQARLWGIIAEKYKIPLEQYNSGGSQ